MTEGIQELDQDESLEIAEEDSINTSLSISISDECTNKSIKSSRNLDQLDINQTPLTHHDHHQHESKLIQENECLKYPDTRLGCKKSDVMSMASPDIPSSMKEFLAKEKLCQTNGLPKSEVENKDKDDTLCDLFASSAFSKYHSDLENATDEDFGSILEEMSKIAEELSPNSAPDRTKSGNSTKNQTEEEKSVEELLEEAEKLVRKNICLSKNSSGTDTVIQLFDKTNNNRVKMLEDDIFNIIEHGVDKKIHKKYIKSPKVDKKNTDSPDFHILFENLKLPLSLENQKKKFDDNKIEVSSSSDLDDPIERHSVSDDKNKLDKQHDDNENLQKELTDADKDFFDSLLRRSREKIEGGLTDSPSFDQEDFSHFIKILERQTDTNSNNNTNNPCEANDDNLKNEYPEKEITQILENEAKKINKAKNKHEFNDSDSSNDYSVKIKTTITNDTNKYVNKNKGEIIKVSNSQNDLYNVGLTPRLELFADEIPKLIAEKASTDKQQITDLQNDDKNKILNHDDKEITTVFSLSLNDDKNNNRKSSIQDDKKLIKKTKTLGPSKSYDQLPKPSTSFRSSLDDIRPTKSADVGKRINLYSKNPIQKSQLLTKNLSSYGSKVKFSIKPTLQKPTVLNKNSQRNKNPETIVKQSLANVETRKNYTKQDFEIMYQEEKHKNALLKNQIESEAKLYKQQIQSMRNSFEEELFALKKQTIIQKSKIDELSLNLNDNNSNKNQIAEINNSDNKIMLFEKELERQENVILTYENENKKLLIETKRLNEELKIQELKQLNKNKPIIVDDSVNDDKIKILTDQIKDLKEEILKLNIEITDLRAKNSDLIMNNDDLSQQISLSQEELSMFKQQLTTKDKFITERLKSMSIHEMETRRKMEELKIELTSKTEKLKLTKCEFDKFQNAIIPLENELIDLRTKEKSYIEKLSISKSHVEREKVLTQKLKDQVILDNKKILDLNRQVREMERILKRKNPDSVSALILTAKSDNEKLNLEKVKLLEDRIATLENENKANEFTNQEKLTELQAKFNEMKNKYSAQVYELEDKLNKSCIKDVKVKLDMSTQTIEKNMENKSVDARRDDKIDNKDDKKESKNIKAINLKSQNHKEDTHLVATIRGLQLELTNKDKTLLKLTKEIQELQKTNRRLQKEREKLLHDRRNNEKSRTIISHNKIHETNDHNSNIYNGQNKLTNSNQKLYDPLEYSENNNTASIEKLKLENDNLKIEINKINKDFDALKNRRLHDLNILQEEHEREIDNIVKEYSDKLFDSNIIKLQGQINTQASIISHLKGQIEKLRDYKEQVVVLKVEREHLENKIKILSEKNKYLTTPETQQLQYLQDKILILQQRHENREKTLQNLIRDLLRNKKQCNDCKDDNDKNKKLCYFRQELDNILVMLQGISSVH
ncbi:hypothetical protein HCN44_006745 [Aphidius gifuensis]|uniref:Centrosomal protein of 162 kDa n=1 Tax=Aphidius gifuensis TaxID=684658 RepID=A0A834XY13_APHGI|nr:protein PFC0760c-like [Aphidius gifuensis]KAF7995638.1 hypothetical protein HCN44_006745 [Aphidius gifuensis]